MTYEELLQHFRRQGKNERRRLKEKLLAHYGSACACCGEDRLEFLAIDHVDGGGNKERKALNLRSGSSFYRWLIRNNYPSGYRVLCHNCNMALGCYGYCPHGLKFERSDKKRDDAGVFNRPLQIMMLLE